MTTCHPMEWSGVSPRIKSLWSTTMLFSLDPSPFHGCFLVAMWLSDLGHIDTVFRTVESRLVKKPETGLTAEFAAPLSLEHQLACRSFITHTRHPLRAEEVEMEGL